MMQKEEVGERTPLNKRQSTWVTDWLEANGATIKRGWYDVYQMTPAEVARKYGVKVAEVISAAKGEQR